VKDLVNPLAPKLDAPVRALYPGHTAAYDPLGVVNGTLYLLTDRQAPNKKVVAVPIDRPDAANWKTIVPESKNSIESARLIAGKLAVNALVDVAERGALLQSRRIARGADCDAGPWIGHRAGRPFRPAGNLLHLHVAAVSRDRVPLRPRQPARARRSRRRSSPSIRRSTRPSVSSPPRRTARVCRCSSRTARI
jgi:hypothetical protein